MDYVCNRCLFSIPSKVEMAEEQEYSDWPIRIQQAGKIYCPHANVSWQERHWNQATFLIGDGMNYSRKGIYNFQNHIALIAKSEKYETFCVSNF